MAYNSRAGEAETRPLLGVEASLDYRMKSRPEAVIQRKSKKNKVTTAVVYGGDPPSLCCLLKAPPPAVKTAVSACELREGTLSCSSQLPSCKNLTCKYLIYLHSDLCNLYLTYQLCYFAIQIIKINLDVVTRPIIPALGRQRLEGTWHV